MDTQQQIKAKLDLIASSWDTIALKNVDKSSFEQLVEDLPHICDVLQADVKRQVRKFVFVLLALFTKLVTEKDLVLPNDQLRSVYLMTWVIMEPSEKGNVGAGRRENNIANGLQNTACIIGKYEWKSTDKETKTTTFSYLGFDCSKIGYRKNINLAELKRQMSILKPKNNNNKRKLAETESASEHSSSSAAHRPTKRMKVSKSNTSNVSSVVSSPEPTSDSYSSSEYRSNEEPSSLSNGGPQRGFMYVSPRSSMEVESPSGASNNAPDTAHANNNNYGDATANEQHAPVAGSGASVCATTNTYWPRELDSVFAPTVVLHEEQLLAFLAYHLTSGTKIEKLIGLLDQHKKIWYSNDVVDQHAVGNLDNHPIAQELLRTEDPCTQHFLGQLLPATDMTVEDLQRDSYQSFADDV